MFPQADAITEERAAGKGAGGVDGDDADGAICMAELLGETIDQAALARAGSAGDADAEGAAGVRETGGKQRGSFGRIVFNEGDGAGERAVVALAKAADEIGDGRCVGCRHS
jgi:hypothetical protein